jgi:hypothetical protein
MQAFAPITLLSAADIVILLSFAKHRRQQGLKQWETPFNLRCNPLQWMAQPSNP